LWTSAKRHSGGSTVFTPSRSPRSTSGWARTGACGSSAWMHSIPRSPVENVNEGASSDKQCAGRHAHPGQAAISIRQGRCAYGGPIRHRCRRRVVGPHRSQPPRPLAERGMPPEMIAGYGAGIQVHVEDLGAHLAGHGRVDADECWKELLPAYQALAADVSYTAGFGPSRWPCQVADIRNVKQALVCDPGPGPPCRRHRHVAGQPRGSGPMSPRLVPFYEPDR